MYRVANKKVAITFISVLLGLFLLCLASCKDKKELIIEDAQSYLQTKYNKTFEAEKGSLDNNLPLKYFTDNSNERCYVNTAYDKNDFEDNYYSCIFDEQISQHINEIYNMNQIKLNFSTSKNSTNKDFKTDSYESYWNKIWGADIEVYVIGNSYDLKHLLTFLTKNYPSKDFFIKVNRLNNIEELNSIVCNGTNRSADINTDISSRSDYPSVIASNNKNYWEITEDNKETQFITIN